MLIKDISSYKTSLDTEGIDMLSKDAQIHLFHSKKKWGSKRSFDEVYDKFAPQSFTNQTEEKFLAAWKYILYRHYRPSQVVCVGFHHQNLLAMKHYNRNGPKGTMVGVQVRSELMDECGENAIPGVRSSYVDAGNTEEPWLTVKLLKKRDSSAVDFVSFKWICSKEIYVLL
jgi:hypothetical protein